MRRHMVKFLSGRFIELEGQYRHKHCGCDLFLPVISPGIGIHRRTRGNALVEAIAVLLVLNGVEEIVLVVDKVDLGSPTIEIRVGEVIALVLPTDTIRLLNVAELAEDGEVEVPGDCKLRERFSTCDPVYHEPFKLGAVATLMPSPALWSI